MKTLDKVIKALEYCLNPVDNFGNCNAGCPYIHCCDPSNHDVTEDALNYLKEYQRLQIAFLKALADLEDNPPLDWDDLKQMEGKPVWIEFEKNGNHWLIITDIKSNGAVGRGVYGENVPLYKDRIGTDWKAYRKERG